MECAGEETHQPSSDLERDNETLRLKLRQLREENSQLIAEKHSLVNDAETAHFELCRVKTKIQNAEKEIGISRAAVIEVVTLREAIEKDRETYEVKSLEWQRRVDGLEENVHTNDVTIGLLNSQLEAIEKTLKKTEC